jgi:hypothetical protein
MNLRWPLWLPIPRNDVFFFVVQVVAVGALLMGGFKNLPVVPAFNEMPVALQSVCLWLGSLTVINYFTIFKQARDDYVFATQAAFPSFLTFALFSCIFLFAVAGQGVSVSWSDLANSDNLRVLLYSQFYVFVALNISFLFKDNSSPVKDIANEIQWLRKQWLRREILPNLPQAERQKLSVHFQDVLQALNAALGRNAALLASDGNNEIRQKVGQALKLMQDQGSEAAFDDLKREHSDLNVVVKYIVEYSP